MHTAKIKKQAARVHHSNRKSRLSIESVPVKDTSKVSRKQRAGDDGEAAVVFQRRWSRGVKPRAGQPWLGLR